MTVFLAPDAVELWLPDAAQDSHGWELPDLQAPPDWTGLGNLQLGPGPSDPRAAEGGGHGPFDPAARESGALYLPPEVQGLRDGAVASVRGELYVLAAVRLVPDPIGGGAAAWVAEVTGTDRWPGGLPSEVASA